MQLFENLQINSRILDVGCLGFQKYFLYNSKFKEKHVEHFGIDYINPDDSMPSDFIYEVVDLNKDPIPFINDYFDLVIATHILEHMKDPLGFFSECIRVLKPGGVLYIETPSERSLILPGMFIEYNKFYSLSFYDDPTHFGRPWSPQSLYRLTKYFSCEPIEVGRFKSWKIRLLFPIIFIYGLIFRKGNYIEKALWESVGWVTFLIAKKIVPGEMQFKYYIPQDRNK